jgi:hypothetical protein
MSDYERLQARPPYGTGDDAGQFRASRGRPRTRQLRSAAIVLLRAHDTKRA